ncbi:hypothetical protein ACU4GD_22120 [Cupriavidus basilensis]
MIVMPLPPSHIFALPWQKPSALVVIHEAHAPVQLRTCCAKSTA